MNVASTINTQHFLSCSTRKRITSLSFNSHKSSEKCRDSAATAMVIEKNFAGIKERPSNDIKDACGSREQSEAERQDLAF